MEASIYQERLHSRGLTALFGILSTVFLFLFVYQALVGPLGEDPAPTWFFLGMALLFLFVVMNFKTLSITMTSRAIVVGYGIFKRTIPWEAIERCYLDEVSTIRYGGWGAYDSGE